MGGLGEGSRGWSWMGATTRGTGRRVGPGMASPFFVSPQVLLGSELLAALCSSRLWTALLAGASLLAYDLGPIELGKARRTGTSVAEDTLSSSDEGGAAVLAMSDGSAAGNGAAAEAQLAATAVAAAAAPAEPKINRRCKRRRRELLELSA